MVVAAVCIILLRSLKSFNAARSRSMRAGQRGSISNAGSVKASFACGLYSIYCKHRFKAAKSGKRGIGEHGWEYHLHH